MRLALLQAAGAAGKGPLHDIIIASAKRVKVKAYGGWNVDRKQGKGHGRRSR